MPFTKPLNKSFAIFLFTSLLISFSANAQEIDLLLKGGHVIDPKNGISETMDIGITGKNIVKIAKKEHRP